METRRIADYSCPFIDFCPRLALRTNVSELFVSCCCWAPSVTLILLAVAWQFFQTGSQSPPFCFCKFKFKCSFHSGFSLSASIFERIFHAHGSSLVSIPLTTIYGPLKRKPKRIFSFQTPPKKSIRNVCLFLFFNAETKKPISHSTLIAAIFLLPVSLGSLARCWERKGQTTEKNV